MLIQIQLLIRLALWTARRILRLPDLGLYDNCLVAAVRLRGDVSREQESIYEAITRRRLLNTIGLVARRAWALAGDKEALLLAEYSSEFRIEAQARDPRVKCSDLRGLNSWKTNNEQFFTLHQSTAPTL